MTAEPPQSPVTEAVRSLEVRWIFPGQLETAVAGWFGRFPAPLLAPQNLVAFANVRIVENNVASLLRRVAC
jgi:hypothetical protein